MYVPLAEICDSAVCRRCFVRRFFFYYYHYTTILYTPLDVSRSLCRHGRYSNDTIIIIMCIIHFVYYNVHADRRAIFSWKIMTSKPGDHTRTRALQQYLRVRLVDYARSQGSLKHYFRFPAHTVIFYSTTATKFLFSGSRFLIFPVTRHAEQMRYETLPIYKVFKYYG